MLSPPCRQGLHSCNPEMLGTPPLPDLYCTIPPSGLLLSRMHVLFLSSRVPSASLALQSCGRSFAIRPAVCSLPRQVQVAQQVDRRSPQRYPLLPLLPRSNKATMSSSASSGSSGLRMSSATSSARTESDAFGEIMVDDTRYWGAQTQRSLMNFPIGGRESRMPIEVIKGG